MRKLFILLFFAILFVSCEEPDTDLPYTDIERYRISGGFSFPKDTTTVDIYNCLTADGVPNNSEKNVAAGSEYSIEQEVILSGAKISDTHTRNISKIITTYIEKGPEINEYTLTLYFDDGSEDFYSDVPLGNDVKPEDKPKLNCIFHYTWQRQTSNEWKNDKIPGILIIKW